MPSGLDTTLPFEAYLSRPVTWQTPFIGLGVLLGVIPAGAMTVNYNILLTELWAAAPHVVLAFSFNPDLSAPVATSNFLEGLLGFAGAAAVTPEVTAFRSGPLYFGVTGAGNTGAGIVTVRFIPRAAGGF